MPSHLDPVKQSLEQDPDGAFIRRWVPELASLPTAALAEPHLMPPMLQQMYGVQIVDPAAIVDNVTAMQRRMIGSSATDVRRRRRRARRRRRSTGSEQEGPGERIAVIV
ncbi:MAG: FAD-binding domain-containing protein [Gemmatimonadaceae bacterium]|nr:FAD-binding domain-containing protein [Gemmatimonadaceae bacterium]